MNISDLIDQYEQGARLRGLAPTQLQALKPIRRALGRRTANNLTPGVINSYVAERRRGEHSLVHGVRPAADGTVRRELGALAAVVNWGHQKRLLTTAPPTIDLPPMSPPREVFLTLAEANQHFLSAQALILMDGDCANAALFYCLALDSWARAASIEGLTWARVNLDAGQIDYREPGRAETKKRRVPVPVSTRLRTVLSDRHNDENPNEGHLVCGPITQHAWVAFKKAVGMRPEITRHDLRRSGISHAVARGVDLMKIAQMAGDNYQTILKFYARFSPSYLDGCVE